MAMHFFITFLLLKEGATEKVLQFEMPLESIYNKTLISLNKNVFLKTTERLKQ
jgi:hypothetical protein